MIGHQPRLILAPMEGVADWVMRDLLTSIGGIDMCVTEFLRVTDRLLPDHEFFHNCPELNNQCRTRSGTPVFLQLLGGQVQPLAENAAKAAQLGALGIDLNFGCPARKVNNHDGGAVLLKTPQRIFNIVSAVRAAVPKETPVTAKIRLGFDDPSVCLENAVAAQEAGALWLTVHARTKVDGYKPPAYWEWIPKIREKISIPIIANGEVWTTQDYFRCREVSQSRDVMIGRGAIANPFLFKQIKQELNNETAPLANYWEQFKPFLLPFFEASTEFVSDKYAVSRTKQWLSQVVKRQPEITPLFDELKLLWEPTEFKNALNRWTE